MDVVTISKNDFSALIDSVIGSHSAEVIGPVEVHRERYSYRRIDGAAELKLDYDETTQSPRRYLFPAVDSVLTYTTGDAASCRPVFDTTRRIIVGVHPGDLAAVALYDHAYGGETADSQYCTRRRNTLFIGLYPTRTFSYRFTSSMIADDACYAAADLMMTDLGDDRFAVEVVSGEGRELIGNSPAKAADAETLALLPGRKRAAPDSLSLPVDRKTLAAILAGREHHETFKKRGDKCFSCGSCVTVCPTCVCFDMVDSVDLSLETGGRFRTWDGCTLPNFATVAGGHNFRKTPADRVRHRLFRKTVYMQERFGLSGCVGCGRCTRACTAEIASICEMVGDIAGKGN